MSHKSKAKRVNLFRASRAKPRRAPRRTWRSLLPWGQSRRGEFLIDNFSVEDMTSAFCGDRRSEEAEFLAGLIGKELAEGRCVLRVFELRDAAPALVEGADHLSCRAANLARRTLRGSEATGSSLPFTAAISKLRRRPNPFAHGFLTMHEGVAMSSVSDRSTIVEDWRGTVPLVIGPSDAHVTWSHMLHTRAIAVWCAGDTRLWLLRALRSFPSAFDQAPAGLPPRSPFEDAPNASRTARRFQPTRGPSDRAEVPASATEQSVSADRQESDSRAQQANSQPSNRAALRREE